MSGQADWLRGPHASSPFLHSCVPYHSSSCLPQNGAIEMAEVIRRMATPAMPMRPVPTR